MDQIKKYHEAIRAPLPVRISLSLLIGTVFLTGLIWIVFSTTGRLPALFPSLVLILVISAPAFILLSIFYKVRIRISKRFSVTSGESEPFLRVFGVKRKGGCYISCRDIQTLEIYPYAVSGFAAVNPFYPWKGKKGEEIILLPGYYGEGIIASYTYEALFSKSRKSRKILFPTQNPQRLLDILNSLVST